MLRPTEVLDKLWPVQRRQQGARALPDSRIRQQAVRGFAKSLSKPIVVLRDEAHVAEEETKEEQSPRWRWKVATGRKICFRALVGWKGHAGSAHGLQHVSPGKAIARGRASSTNEFMPLQQQREGSSKRMWVCREPGGCQGASAHTCLHGSMKTGSEVPMGMGTG